MKRFLYGRDLAPLLKPLIACLIVAGLIFFFETQQPAFHDVVKIGYFIIAVIFIITAGRALRTRRVSDRRQEDRRGKREEP